MTKEVIFQRKLRVNNMSDPELIILIFFVGK